MLWVVLGWVWVLFSCSLVDRTYIQTEQSLTALGRGDAVPEKEVDRLCRHGATALCALIHGETVQASNPLSIMQGQSDLQFSRFTVVAPKEIVLIYVVLELGSKEENGIKVHRVLKAQASYSREYSPWKVDHIVVDGLQKQSLYELWVIGPRGTLWDRRRFSAFNVDKKNPHVMVASCMDDRLTLEQQKAWKRLSDLKPDVVFLIGDNVYADLGLLSSSFGADPETLWKRYIQVRNSLDLFKWPQLVPLYAVWDDHDYGHQDGDRTYKFRLESQDVFNTFFPQPEAPPSWRRGPGVAGALQAFGSTFVFLDDRTFRSPNKIDLQDQTHFGEEQEQWLWNLAHQEQGPLWLISGDQFFGGYHNFESYEGSHGKSFAQFKNQLKKIKRPLVFISGDRHLAEIMKVSRAEVGQETYELTSSGIHAQTYPQTLIKNPNPRRLVGSAGPFNFMELILGPVSQDLQFHLQAQVWGVDEGLLFQRDLIIHRQKKLVKKPIPKRSIKPKGN